MYTKYRIFINKVHDHMFLLQPQMYITSNPEPVQAPTVIKLQLIWNSESIGRHVSFSRALNYQGDYDTGLRELLAVFRYALPDAQTLGTSPFHKLIHGVNYD